MLRHILAASLAFGISATSASANTYWFDGGTVDIDTNGNSAASVTTNITHNWNSTVKNCDAGAVTHIAWPNMSTDTAVFGGPNSRTVAATGTQAVGTISMINSGWAFNGGALRGRHGIQTINGPVTVTANS